MNAAAMTALDYGHQRHGPQDSMPASSLDLDSSLFGNPLFTYPALYNPLTAEYDLGLDYAERNLAHEANVSPQQIFGHHTTTYPELVALHIQESGNEMPEFNIQDSPLIKLEASAPEGHDFNFEIHELEGAEVLDSVQGKSVGTDVDTLMKAIQKRPSHQDRSSTELRLSSGSPSSDSCLSSTSASNRSSSRSKRRYPCKLRSCAKIFTQKTHLEIHMRAHTGYKPYVWFLCGKRKSIVLT